MVRLDTRPTSASVLQKPRIVAVEIAGTGFFKKIVASPPSTRTLRSFGRLEALGEAHLDKGAKLWVAKALPTYSGKAKSPDSRRVSARARLSRLFRDGFRAPTETLNDDSEDGEIAVIENGEREVTLVTAIDSPLVYFTCTDGTTVKLAGIVEDATRGAVSLQAWLRGESATDGLLVG